MEMRDTDNISYSQSTIWRHREKRRGEFLVKSQWRMTEKWNKNEFIR